MVIPGGNLGNASALGKGLEMLLSLGLLSKRPRIAVAQAQKANPLYLAYQRAKAENRSITEDDFHPITAERTLASAIQIGDPVSLPKAVRALVEFDGVVEQASEQELAEAVARADRTGMFNCPHTGVALACLTIYWIIAGRIWGWLRRPIAMLASLAGATAVVMHGVAASSTVTCNVMTAASALSSAALLGGACTSMVLGHWYLVSYTFSRSLTTAPAPRGNFTYETGPSNFDIPHLLALSFGAELPFGSGKPLLGGVGKLANALVAGWQVQGIINYRSGLPFTPTISRDVANTGVGGQITQGRRHLSHHAADLRKPGQQLLDAHLQPGQQPALGQVADRHRQAWILRKQRADPHEAAQRIRVALGKKGTAGGEPTQLLADALEDRIARAKAALAKRREADSAPRPPRP